MITNIIRCITIAMKPTIIIIIIIIIVYWEAGHRTYFVDEGNTWGGDTTQHRKMGGGTPHILC